ncbi:MAG: aminopeptidase N [Acetobacter sp.]|nr:aminopeptidase N [Acetobacter sp.]
MEKKIKYLKDYKKPDYKIRTVDLTFDLDEQNTTVKSVLHLVADYDVPKGGHPLVLDGRELELKSIKIDGEAVDERAYSLDDESLTIYNPPADFKLEIETVIHPKANTKLEGLYVSNGTFCSQNEPEGFRRITYFLDHPDVMSVYTTTLIADKSKYPVMLSNGNPIKEETLPDGKTAVTWFDPFPKPCYLFCVVVGDLGSIHDTYTTKSGRLVKLGLYVEHGEEPKAEWGLESLKRAMKWDEDVYGLEYDLDLFNIVAVSDFNMGAMENKGLNLFNSSCALADPVTATDTDFAHVEGVIAHEYFHNWSGDRVTARDWFNLSLKEGLTVYRDQEFSRDMRGRTLGRINDVFALRTFQFPEDAGPLAHSVRPESYVEINNYYTATVYDKGAEVIRMYERLLGKETFIKGNQLYFERHDGQAVTIDDYAKCMEDVSGKDLTLFKRWYSQAGTPTVYAAGKYDGKAKTYTLTLRQETKPTPNQPEKLPFVIPLGIGLIGKDGKDMPLQLQGEKEPQGTSRVIVLDKDSEVFTFVNVAEQPVLSGNRDFTAPIHFVMDYTDAERLHQARCDSDLFNRWDAFQQYGVEQILNMVKDIQNGKEPTLPEAYFDVWESYLTDKTLDKGFVARAITLPQENYLADQMDVVDVDAIHKARYFVKQAIAKRFEKELRTVYDENNSDAEYTPSPEQSARRALKNMALSFLGDLGTNNELVEKQYAQANNMTDKLAAMNIASNSKNPKREAIMDDFYQTYKNEKAAVNKWIFTNACADRPDAVNVVRKLLTHPAFNIKNPNNVRSLMGGFAYNQTEFHKLDGSGYDFAVEMAYKMDDMNPQMAAHMVKPLTRWKRFDAKRQEMMKKALEKVLEKKNLSKNVYELVTKSLAA